MEGGDRFGARARSMKVPDSHQPFPRAFMSPGTGTEASLQFGVERGPKPGDETLTCHEREV